MDPNHMLLPPLSNVNANNLNLNRNSPDPAQTQIQTQTQHRSSHQQLLSTKQQAYPALSPPYSSPSPFYNYNTTAALRSSSSPRPLGPVPSYPPPSYAFTQQPHDPSTLNFPEAPSTELAPLLLNSHYDTGNNTLPSLSSLTGTPASSRRFPASSSTTSDPSYSPPQGVRRWPSGNPLTVYYDPSHAPHSTDSPGRMDIDGISMGIRGPASPSGWADGRASSVTLDDPDVRMAAEALGDLRADFVSSPMNKNTPIPNSPANQLGTHGQPQPEEPLLSLVMTSHPLLAKTIEGTTSAYNTSKNFSPRFKTGVEYVEGFVTPIANTVGSVGRVTGVEGGVRWFLGGARRHQSSSDLEAGEAGSNNKRRKVDSRGGSSSLARREAGAGIAPLTSADRSQDPYGFAAKDRRLSMSTIDSLPAYDDHRSPAYTEKTDQGDQTPTANMDRQLTPTQSTSSTTATTPTAWQSRLILSTSGLSIAMSEESLRSLKYCLKWLRWANEHIGRIIGALKDALEKFEPTHQIDNGEDHAMADAHYGSVASHDDERARQELGARISILRSDVLKTLRDVIDTVSKYAGGALPDNARNLVRRHLTSFPQRFRLATQNSTQNSNSSDNVSTQEQREGKEREMREGAQRVLVLAKEGLDMMAQVSGVLDGTIVSAEEWCERLGKKKREDHQEGAQEQQELQQQQGYPAAAVPFTGVGVDGDVKMS